MRALADPVAYRAIQRRLFRLEDGNLGDYEAFESLLELRIDYGPGYRIYCGKEGGACIVFLVGGTKKEQRQDIDKAKRYWAVTGKGSPAPLLWIPGFRRISAGMMGAPWPYSPSASMMNMKGHSWSRSAIWF